MSKCVDLFIFIRNLVRIIILTLNYAYFNPYGKSNSYYWNRPLFLKIIDDPNRLFKVFIYYI